jgi:DNA mismatch endonuclease (patch repair protein)
MARVRSRNTKPEMAVRQVAHALGYRYRLHIADLPGKPDLVFRSRRKIIFVHGCFWHQHDGCPRAALPQANRQFWEAKLQRNVERGAAQTAALEAAGWEILIVWECETKKREQIASLIDGFLADEQSGC